MTQQISEFDAITNETIQRDANKDEIAHFKARAIKIANIKAEAETKAEAKAALLDRLGISADEAKLLFG